MEYDKYQMDKMVTAKAEFRILLKETKLITYKSRDLVLESERHYKDIITVLKVSRREGRGRRVVAVKRKQKASNRWNLP